MASTWTWRHTRLLLHRWYHRWSLFESMSDRDKEYVRRLERALEYLGTRADREGVST